MALNLINNMKKKMQMELQLSGLNQWGSGYLGLSSNKMDPDPTCQKPYTDLAHTFSVISLPLESGSGELKYCGFNGSADPKHWCKPWYPTFR